MKNSKLTLAKTHDACASGEPRLCVVMIHGIASDSTTYRAALEYLEAEQKLADARFVTFDLLGAGESPKDDTLEYTYAEQLEALHNAISELKSKTPLVLVGHSLGTFIVTRYASAYPDEVARLILVSAPIYTEKDFANPAFAAGIEAFKQAVSARRPEILQEKAFNNSMKNIVLDQKNYATLAGMEIPTTLICGDEDQLIASYNIPELCRDNRNIKSIITSGRHGVSQDKYCKIPAILEEVLTASAG